MYVKHSVGVRVVVGNVADIRLLLERDAERGCVVRLSTHAACSLPTPHKVVFVVADSSTNTVPERPTLQCLRHGEHDRTHAWQTTHLHVVTNTVPERPTLQCLRHGEHDRTQAWQTTHLHVVTNTVPKLPITTLRLRNASDKKSVKYVGVVLTKVELAVNFLTVDNVELVWNTSLHAAHFEVKPLMMMVCVDVTVEYQVILVLTNLAQQQQPLISHHNHITTTLITTTQLHLSQLHSSQSHHNYTHHNYTTTLITTTQLHSSQLHNYTYHNYESWGQSVPSRWTETLE